MKKKRCSECGIQTDGCRIKDPLNMLYIYIDTVCPTCLEEIIAEAEDEFGESIMKLEGFKEEPGAVEVVARLPSNVPPIDPPLGWVDLNGKEYIERRYERTPILGERYS